MLAVLPSGIRERLFHGMVLSAASTVGLEQTPGLEQTTDLPSQTNSRSAGASHLLATFPFAGYPKPRMTQRDKWLNPPRECVANYRRYSTNVRIFAARQRFAMPACAYLLLFLFEFPARWSKKKKTQFMGQPHTSKPDKDNLEKGILDALLPDNDAGVWDGRVTKLWWSHNEIRIYRTDPPWDTIPEVAQQRMTP